jgi:Ca2+-binding RTX toxin-like protein
MDPINGTSGDDTLNGTSGDDVIYGLGGNDTLDGGDGVDTVSGGDGDDIIVGGGQNGFPDAAPDTLLGGPGNDLFAAGYGDAVDGGTGTDSLRYDGRNGTAGITADFSQLTSGGTITVGGASLSGIEFVSGVSGTDYNDTIVGGATNDGMFTILGMGGDDHLTGTSGVYRIDGGDGNDVLVGGPGGEWLIGGDGTDTYVGTAAELRNDIIARIDAGETIVITDADPNTFSFEFSQGILSYSGGGLTINGGIPGRFVASAAPGGGVQITVEPLPVATVDQIATQLTTNYWSWRGEDAHHFDVTEGGTITVDIHTLTADEQTLARAAFAEWHDIIGVNFQEVTSGAQILVTDDEGPTQWQYSIFAEATSSNGITQSAHVNISSSALGDETALNSSRFQLYLNEIGRALGLGNAGDYDSGGGYSTGTLFANDGWPLSIMSGFDQSQARYFSDQGFTYSLAVTPMQADILAMQSMYGLSTTTRTGDTVYGFHSNAGDVYDPAAFHDANVAFTIFDNGGNDTLDYSLTSAAQEINLNAETFSNVNGYTGNLSIARGVIIENAIGGSGNDTLIGNFVANKLIGGAGSDTIKGNDGDDTLDGGAGADNVDGGAGNDRIVYDAADTLAGGAGSDTLVVKNIAAPTAFNLGSHGFESAEVTQTDAGNTHSWSSVVSTYNASWQLTQQTTLNDDHSILQVQLDPANLVNTTQVWNSFDTQGRLSYVDQFFDDGTRTFINVDEDNSQGFTQNWFTYDAQGRLDLQDVHNDDGTRTWINFDQAGDQAFAQNWITYDAAGKLDWQDVIYDDGTHTFINFDNAGAETWSQAWFTYDAQGRLDTQDVVNDDGSHTFYNWDQDGSQPFNYVANIYDTAGTLTEQVIAWDDGHTTDTMF